jgi:F-type H+-transporting ATPase subunit delta
MVSGSLARRYAKAIFEIGTTGAAQGNLDKIGRDLRTLAGAMKTSPELVSSLTNPAIRRDERRKVVDALLANVGAHSITHNAMHLLLERERLATLPAIARELDAMIEAKAGRVHAELVSARPLDAAQVSQITTALEKVSGKTVTVEKREDPALLGGVVAKIGDVVYDGSLRTQLQTLRDDLAR